MSFRFGAFLAFDHMPSSPLYKRTVPGFTIEFSFKSTQARLCVSNMHEFTLMCVVVVPGGLVSSLLPCRRASSCGGALFHAGALDPFWPSPS